MYGNYASDRIEHNRARNSCNLQFAICNFQSVFSPACFALPPWPPRRRSAGRSGDPQGADLASAASRGRQGPGRRLAATARGRRGPRHKAVAIVGGISDQATGSELLDRLAETFAMVDPKVAELVEICSHPRSRMILPTFAWMTDPKTAPLVAANMRLYYGRWLVQGQWFEEALEQLGGLKTGEVVAPAELLFYQGVTYHRMLNKDEGLKVINQLLDGAEASPRRYVAVAYLMQADLELLGRRTRSITLRGGWKTCSGGSTWAGPDPRSAKSRTA